jgi:predicted phage tail protein
MYGGGGKFTTIIMGTALIVAGFLIGGPVGVSLMVSGGIMVLQGVVTLFMKAPSLSKANDPAPSKYLTPNKNTTEAGTPIQNAWGRVQLAPHWLSIQSDSDNLAYGVFPENPT